MLRAKKKGSIHELAEMSDTLKADAHSEVFTATGGSRKVTQKILLPEGTKSVPFCSVDVVGGYSNSVAGGYISHSVIDAGSSKPQLEVTFYINTSRTDKPNVTVLIRFLYK